MTTDMELKLAAFLEALEGLVGRLKAKGVPWHYGAQISKLERNLETIRRTRDMDLDLIDPDDRELHRWLKADQIAKSFTDSLIRLQTGPLRDPDIAAAAEEMDPFGRELVRYAQALAPEWTDENMEPLAPDWGRDEAPDGSWPAGDNPDHDDLDLGRKD